MIWNPGRCDARLGLKALRDIRQLPFFSAGPMPWRGLGAQHRTELTDDLETVITLQPVANRPPKRPRGGCTHPHFLAKRGCK